MKTFYHLPSFCIGELIELLSFDAKVAVFILCQNHCIFPHTALIDALELTVKENSGVEFSISDKNVKYQSRLLVSGIYSSFMKMLSSSSLYFREIIPRNLEFTLLMMHFSSGIFFTDIVKQFVLTPCDYQHIKARIQVVATLNQYAQLVEAGFFKIANHLPSNQGAYIEVDVRRNCFTFHIRPREEVVELNQNLSQLASPYQTSKHIFTQIILPLVNITSLDLHDDFFPEILPSTLELLSLTSCLIRCEYRTKSKLPHLKYLVATNSVIPPTFLDSHRDSLIELKYLLTSPVQDYAKFPNLTALFVTVVNITSITCPPKLTKLLVHITGYSDKVKDFLKQIPPSLKTLELKMYDDQFTDVDFSRIENLECLNLNSSNPSYINKTKFNFKRLHVPSTLKQLHLINFRIQGLSKKTIPQSLGTLRIKNSQYNGRPVNGWRIVRIKKNSYEPQTDEEATIIIEG